MFWRQETSLGFNYPSRRPRASRPSISSHFSLPARLHAVCSASSLATVPWPVCPSTYFHGRITDSVGSVGTGKLALPVCQPKTHVEGIAEIKAKERSSNLAPRRPVHLFGPRPSLKTLNKTVDNSCRGCRRRLLGRRDPAHVPIGVLTDAVEAQQQLGHVKHASKTF